MDLAGPLSCGFSRGLQYDASQGFGHLGVNPGWGPRWRTLGPAPDAGCGPAAQRVLRVAACSRSLQHGGLRVVGFLVQGWILLQLVCRGNQGESAWSFEKAISLLVISYYGPWAQAGHPASADPGDENQVEVPPQAGMWPEELLGPSLGSIVFHKGLELFPYLKARLE